MTCDCTKPTLKVYGKLDREVFLAILDEAKKVALKVVGHVPDSSYIKDAGTADKVSNTFLDLNE